MYIYDNRLSIKIFQMDLSRKFDLRFLSRDEEHIIISNHENYFELSLFHFRKRKNLENYLEDDSRVCYWVLDKRVFPQRRRVPEYFLQRSGEESKLFVYEDVDLMSLNFFPLLGLRGCFKKNSYLRYIREYSEYYFFFISKNANYDDMYGPLNPQIMLIYHNDYANLEANLAQFGYISNHKHYLSPLEYCFKLNYYNCTRVICEHLTANPQQISLSKRDFQNLLESNYVYCHNLLSKAFRQHINCPISKMVYMSHNFRIHMQKDYLEINQEIIRNDAKKKKRSREHTDLFSFEVKDFKFSQNKTEVEVFCPEIPIDFKYGSLDSMLFLDNYSNTPSSDFLTSEWKFLMFQKWYFIKFIYLLIFSLYFWFIVLFTLSTVFFKDNAELRYVTYVPIGLLILFEVLEIISFISFNPARYFKDIINLFDILILIGSVVFLSIYSAANEGTNWYRVYGIVIKSMIYYRGFYYLKIFDPFTTIVGMINIIIVKIYAFLIIVIYFYFACVIILIGITNTDSVIDHLRDIYIWVVFGGIDQDSFAVNLSFLVVGLGTILVTVILLNILIAYLSNLFSSLEETQTLDDLREKATFLLNIEIIIRFFRYFMMGKVSVIENVRRQNYDILLSNDTQERTDFMVKAAANQRLTSTSTANVKLFF